MNFPMNYEQYKMRPHDYSKYSGNDCEVRRNHNNRNNDDREINNLIATIFKLCFSCKKKDRPEAEDNSV